MTILKCCNTILHLGLIMAVQSSQPLFYRFAAEFEANFLTFVTLINHPFSVTAGENDICCARRKVCDVRSIWPRLFVNIIIDQKMTSPLLTYSNEFNFKYPKRLKDRFIILLNHLNVDSWCYYKTLHLFIDIKVFEG